MITKKAINRKNINWKTLTWGKYRKNKINQGSAAALTPLPVPSLLSHDCVRRWQSYNIYDCYIRSRRRVSFYRLCRQLDIFYRQSFFYELNGDNHSCWILDHTNGSTFPYPSDRLWRISVAHLCRLISKYRYTRRRS